MGNLEQTGPRGSSMQSVNSDEHARGGVPRGDSRALDLGRCQLSEHGPGLDQRKCGQYCDERADKTVEIVIYVDNVATAWKQQIQVPANSTRPWQLLGWSRFREVDLLTTSR